MITIQYHNQNLIFVEEETAHLQRMPVRGLLLDWSFEHKGNGVFECSQNVRGALITLTSLLSSRGIEYLLDSTAQELLDDYEEEINRISEAREAGELVKSSAKSYSLIKIDGFKRDLYPYQNRALHHMISVVNPANFSVPGSGKTTMAYAYFQYLRNNGIVDKLLVIGPISSFKVWEKEFGLCIEGDEKVARINGTQRQRFYGDESYTVYLTNYHLALRDRSEIVKHIINTGRYLVVVDESHYIKNSGEGAIKTALLDISRYATRRMIATGTPCPNTLMDFHSQFAFLWPSEGITGNKMQFEKFINQNKVEDVRDSLKPFFYRIQKEELDLPNPIFHDSDLVPMPPIQQRIYDAIREKAISSISKLSSNDARLNTWRRAWVIRLNQAMSNPSLLIGADEEFEEELLPQLDQFLDQHIVELAENYYRSGEVPAKFSRCLNILNELRENEVYKVVVWTNFKKNISMFKKILDGHGWEVKVVSGDVSKDESNCNNRDQVIEDFRNSTVPTVLLATPASCAEAISLHHECHHMVFLDFTFNAAHWMQAKDRIHRIGMSKEVETHYYILLTDGSYDNDIYLRIKEKEDRMIAICNSDFPIPEDGGDEISLDQLLDGDGDPFTKMDDELLEWRKLQSE